MKVRLIPTIVGILILPISFSGCDTPVPAPQSYKVDITGMKFVPATITAAIGDTVTWTNKDMMAHDVTEEAAKTWTSGPIAPDSSWKMVVRGTAEYYCSIHAVMKGQIRLSN